MRAAGPLLAAWLAVSGCGGDEVARPDAAVVDAAVVVDVQVPPELHAHLVITPATHDFGQALLGDHPRTFTFTVSNDGTGSSGALSVMLVGLGPDFELTGTTCSEALAAGGSCIVVARFKPSRVGSTSATLTVSAAPGGSVKAMLEGYAFGREGISISPNLVDFGSITAGAIGAPVTFTLVNFSGLRSGAPSATVSGRDFRLASNDCVQPLDPNGTCTVSVRFTPVTTGLKTATLSVSATPGGQGTVTLNGMGTP